MSHEGVPDLPPAPPHENEAEFQKNLGEHAAAMHQIALEENSVETDANLLIPNNSFETRKALREVLADKAPERLAPPDEEYTAEEQKYEDADHIEHVRARLRALSEGMDQDQEKASETSAPAEEHGPATSQFEAAQEAKKDAAEKNKPFEAARSMEAKEGPDAPEKSKDAEKPKDTASPEAAASKKPEGGGGTPKIESTAQASGGKSGEGSIAPLLWTGGLVAAGAALWGTAAFASSVGTTAGWYGAVSSAMGGLHVALAPIAGFLWPLAVGVAAIGATVFALREMGILKRKPKPAKGGAPKPAAGK